MDLLTLMQRRRSVRKYTDVAIPDDKIQQILQAGLLSPSSRGVRPWALIVVRNRAVLEKMAHCRQGAAKMLMGADAAIVVVADAGLSDVWVEDCAIVMSNMHLMAESLGVGSCWIQGRLREASDGRTAEEYLRELLKFPVNYRLEAILSLGMPEGHPAMRELSELPMDKVHMEQFRC